MDSNPSAKRKRFVLTTFVTWLLHRYFLASRSLTLGVRAVVRSKDGKFLLVRHSYTPGWHFPGGGVEQGETIKGALKRELLEETGYIMVGEGSLHGVFHNCQVSQRDHVLVYICEVEENSEAPASNLEIIDIGFFDADKLPNDIDSGAKARIQEIVYNLIPVENW